VFDPVPGIRPWPLRLGAFQPVERDVDGPVADRVHRELPPGEMAVEDDLGEGVWVVEQLAGVVEAGVGLAQRGGARHHAAVGEDLQRPEPEPFATESGAQAEVDGAWRLVGRMRCSRPGGGGGDHELYA